MSLTNKDQFQAWVESPPTQEFLGFLKAAQVRLMEEWGNRGVSLPPETQAQAVLLGQLSRVCFRDSDRPEDSPLAATIEDLAQLKLEETTDG